MATARKSFLMVAAMGMLMFSASPALADWDPGDYHKMHYPQLPDPNGWDVNFTYPKVLADDWLCTGTGPVEDIHFWFSTYGDQPSFPVITGIHASIHADIPDPDGTGPLYSMPGPLLWSWDFLPGEFTIRSYGAGPQGWYDPNIPYYVPDDHFGIWQANIEKIREPFIQQEGTIYWLDLSVMGEGMYGWKTSLQHFNDDAVWGDFPATGGPVPEWMELRDPMTPPPGMSLDLAFVITPEPGTTAMLLGCGLVGMAMYVWRRRK